MEDFQNLSKMIGMIMILIVLGFLISSEIKMSVKSNNVDSDSKVDSH
jgi:hypothetical protein